MTALVILAGLVFLAGIAFVPNYNRHRIRAVGVAKVRAALAEWPAEAWPTIDPDLQQPDSRAPDRAVRPRRTVTLSGAHPQRHGAPKHRRVA